MFYIHDYTKSCFYFSQLVLRPRLAGGAGEANLIPGGVQGDPIRNLYSLNLFKKTLRNKVARLKATPLACSRLNYSIFLERGETVLSPPQTVVPSRYSANTH